MSQNHEMRKWNFLIAAAVILLDRVAKWAVSANIAMHDTLAIIPGFFRLTHVENSGAAFGLFDQSPSQWKLAVLIAFSVVALIVVSILLWRNSFAMNTTGVGLSLIMGGALGNLWDRIIDGRVVDFLEFYLGSYHWPAFNVADSAIVIGAVLLMSEILFAKPAQQEKAVGR